MVVFLVLAGAGLFWYFTRSIETVNGTVHFTKYGHEQAMARLAGVSVSMAAAQAPGANLTLSTGPAAAGGVTGLQAVQTAEQTGGVVLLSDTFTERPSGALLVICSPGQEKVVAVPGSGLAVLSVTPP